MAELTMSKVNTQDFHRACMACVLAFGCMVKSTGDSVEISCFRAGDAEVICETLQETGSAVIALVYVEEV